MSVLFLLKRNAKKIISLTILFLSALSNAVYASDLKTYPALMCIEEGTETGDFNRSMYRITRVKDNGNGVLLCPIVRDSVDESAGYNNVFAIVNTYRTQSGPPIELSLLKFSAKGELMKKISARPRSGHKETHLKIKFEKDWGYYVLKIKMGVNKSNAYSKVFSYLIVE